MAYVKNIWVDQDVERPKTYEVTNNQDGSITLTDSFGLVTELGTPVNEVNMNHIEDGIDGCAIRKHNLTETFNLGEWVLGGTGDDEGIYKSLIANNVGNAISDDTKWEKVEMGGNSRNIGEIVTSTIPLTDAGLHLLDGALLQYGSYQAFIDYIAELYDSGDYTAIFDTEANWQSAVATYGVCSKFVYDSVNNTVRLPKYGNQIFTTNNISTATTLPVKGNGLTLGLTNGAINVGLNRVSGSGDASYMVGPSTAQYGKNVSTTQQSNASGSTAVGGYGVTTDSTKSGIVTDITSLTNQYGLDVYYYIVLATSTKTAIQVDIDEIATDLNGKADVNGNNMVSSVKNFDSSFVYSWSTVATGATVPTSGTVEYDISSYLPNDNYNYEVYIDAFIRTANSANSYLYLRLSTDLFTDENAVYACGAITRASTYALDASSFTLPVGTGRKLIVHSYSSYTGDYTVYLFGYRRIGTNQ